MDILSTLEKLKKDNEFKTALYRAGCDEETVQDALKYPLDSREFLINYFESKQKWSVMKHSKQNLINY